MTNNPARWNIWPEDSEYGKVLYKRAVGEAQEMESSKAASRQLKGILKSGDSLLDVGCGAGHYLTSLRRAGFKDFSYTGVDSTQNYLDHARQAFVGDASVQFKYSDIFNIELPDQYADVVMCNNVLLHLPSIAKPLSELCRVAKRFVLIRTLCGARSFRVMDVHPNEGGNDFEESGEPKVFHYFNIYSQDAVRYMLSKIPAVASIEIEEDRDFDPQKIEAAVAEQSYAPDVTRMQGQAQTNGYIISPWAFIRITLSR
jgi:ubiquinone/menaquinone biosynthesis C-methylase UbiE